MAPLCVKGRQFVLAPTEVNTGAGAIDVYVDGTKVKTVSANGPSGWRSNRWCR
jgi:hypothetical protein